MIFTFKKFQYTKSMRRGICCDACFLYWDGGDVSDGFAEEIGFIGVGAHCDVVKFFPFEALVAVAAVHQGFQLPVDVHVID